MAARHRRRDVVEGLREHRRTVGVAASDLGAKEKHSVPRVWPWCKETKPMARECRATRGRLTERISGLGSKHSNMELHPKMCHPLVIHAKLLLLRACTCVG